MAPRHVVSSDPYERYRSTGSHATSRRLGWINPTCLLRLKQEDVNLLPFSSSPQSGYARGSVEEVRQTRARWIPHRDSMTPKKHDDMLHELATSAESVV